MKAVFFAGLLSLGSLALAGPGHDHGEAAPPAVSGGPQRQADGSVFLPKPAQRQMGVRTLPVEAAALPRAFLLHGRVVMDPNAGGQVQALQAGRVAPPPGGLPQLGQRVQRGQLLAYLEPAAGALERSAQSAQVAELRAAQQLAEKQLARLQDLADTVPRRDIEAAQSSVQSLQARVAALSQGLTARESLLAPVSGVIASSHAVAGQVLDARELLFEIVDPTRLRIEALAYDPAIAKDLGAAFLEGAGAQQGLKFLGAGSALREQALPLNFAAVGNLNLALGQPVQVVVQSRSTVSGFAVPAEALMKNSANQTIVWVKTAPERFVPRVVQAAALDGARVVVTQGLESGDRVVTAGATLVNQVR